MESGYTTYNYVGGLGNQLFGIYTCLSYALKHNKNPIFEYKTISPSITHRITYWNTIFKTLKTYFNENIKWNKIEENNEGIYNKNHYNPNENIMFDGYFQSYHNFIDNYKEINKILCIEEQKQIVKNKYMKYFDKKQNIAIHFRLGDYKKLQQHHPLLPDSYYINALKHIDLNENQKLLIFCEKEDYDFIYYRVQNILRNIMKSHIECILIDINNEIDEFFLMSLCDYIIIANSTFSWWSAFFSNHVNIYIPYKWFHGNTREGLILKNWKIVLF